MYIVFKSKWTKWELIDEGVNETKTVVNRGFGYKYDVNVVCDHYRRLNNKTGVYQYKRVERFKKP